MSDLAHLLPGKTFRSTDDRRRRVKIKSFTPGGTRAVVVNAATGKTPRWVRIDNLHPTPLNRLGKPWRSGYILEES